jgi:hypothetical protein
MGSDGGERRLTRRSRRGALVSTLVAGVLLATSAATALATTGPYILRAPKFKVGAAVAKLYPGRYTMRSAIKGAKLKEGHLGIEVNGDGFLDGIAQFEQYDATGTSTWTATLYDFRILGKNRMQISVLGPGGKPLLALMRLVRDKDGNFTGQFTQNGRNYPVSWHRTSKTA